MSRSIQLDSNGNDITCMKEFDALKYPCEECDRADCDEREEYLDYKNRGKHDISKSRQKESIYGT